MTYAKVIRMDKYLVSFNAVVGVFINNEKLDSLYL